MARKILIISLLSLCFLSHSCKKEIANDNNDIYEEGTFTDPRDGIVYKTVKIGNQVWMAENLKATKYSDGTDIPNVTSNYGWYDQISDAYCWYDNDPDIGNTYGALYNWYAVNTGKLCPTGWHVPSDAEWTALTDYLGGKIFAGCKLKEAGTVHWNSPNTGATNETGFTALPGGGRGYEGKFNSIGGGGYWWCATEYYTNAWLRYMYYYSGNVYRSNHGKENGYSVRCVRD